ncbi:hypothetical protein [Streptomyces sp. NPDC001536]|uniref:hypothetical protein n=1 Tax=Streptomyces sp. NPDC001536 TaxID=3364583 RepID=UPI0036A44862
MQNALALTGETSLVQIVNVAVVFTAMLLHAHWAALTDCSRRAEGAGTGVRWSEPSSCRAQAGPAPILAASAGN